MFDTRFIARQLKMHGHRFFEVEGVSVFPMSNADGSFAPRAIAYMINEKFESSPIARSGSLGLGGLVGGCVYGIVFEGWKDYSAEMIKELADEAAKELA